MAGMASALLDPNVKLKYKIKVKEDPVTPVISSFIGGILKDTAVSAGQVANESFSNPIISPVGSLLGKNFLSNEVSKINKEAGKSMRGNVTPMDIFNTASLIPNPASLGAKTGSLFGRLLMKNAPAMRAYMNIPETAALTTRGNVVSGVEKPVGNDLFNILDAVPRTSNITMATTEQILDPTGKHRSGKTNQAVQAKRERERSEQRLASSGYATTTKSTGLKAREWGQFASEAAEANPRYVQAALKSRPPWWKFVYGRKVNYDMLPEDIKYYMDQVAGKEWESGHNLRSGLRGSVTHLVSGELNQLAESAKRSGVKVLTDKNYRPVLEWAYTNNPKYSEYKSVEHLADALGANHLMGYSATKLKRIIAGDFS